MEVIEKHIVPVYELECCECKSKIRYKASEVFICHITCPVCGVPNWANTTCPVNEKEYETTKTADEEKVLAGLEACYDADTSCKNCPYGTYFHSCKKHLAQDAVAIINDLIKQREVAE